MTLRTLWGKPRGRGTRPRVWAGARAPSGRRSGRVADRPLGHLGPPPVAGRARRDMKSSTATPVDEETVRRWRLVEGSPLLDDRL